MLDLSASNFSWGMVVLTVVLGTVVVAGKTSKVDPDVAFEARFSRPLLLSSLLLLWFSAPRLAGAAESTALTLLELLEAQSVLVFWLVSVVGVEGPVSKSFWGIEVLITLVVSELSKLDPAVAFEARFSIALLLLLSSLLLRWCKAPGRLAGGAE